MKTSRTKRNASFMLGAAVFGAMLLASSVFAADARGLEYRAISINRQLVVWRGRLRGTLFGRSRRATDKAKPAHRSFDAPALLYDA